MTGLSPDRVRHLRLEAQRLHPRAGPDALVDTVRAVCGVQAQLPSASHLACRARIDGLQVDDVDSALAERRLVRTWAMRGTLHLIAAEDVGWIVGLLGPTFADRDRRRREQLGLTEDLSQAALRVIPGILDEWSPLTRWELVDRLGERGVEVSRQGQAAIHLITYAALSGILTVGPDRAKGESTYVRLEGSLAPAPEDRSVALARLAERYVAGYGPAGVADFARWSGLTMTEARQGWASLGQNGASSPPPKSAPFSVTDPVVSLLPAFDTYLLGYADRDNVVRPEHQAQVYHGGQVVPVVLANGLAVGTWRYRHRGKRLEIRYNPFDRPEGTNSSPERGVLLRGVEAEVADIGRFLDAPVSLVES